MTQEGRKQSIIRAVRKLDDGDDSSVNLLARFLEEADTAQQTLRDKGYGWTGLGLLDMIRIQVPARPCLFVKLFPLRLRIRLAWKVFVGEILLWPNELRKL